MMKLVPLERSLRQPSKRKAALRRSLAEAGMISDAASVFRMLPEIEKVATKYAWYLSAELRINEQGVVANALAEAIPALINAYRKSERQAVQKFIHVLHDHAKQLAEYRISIQNQSGDRVIWDYSSPLSDLLLNCDQQIVMVRKRQKAIDSGVVAVKLLSYICTSADLQVAGISLVSPTD